MWLQIITSAFQGSSWLDRNILGLIKLYSVISSFPIFLFQVFECQNDMKVILHGIQLNCIPSRIDHFSPQLFFDESKNLKFL